MNDPLSAAAAVWIAWGLVWTTASLGSRATVSSESFFKRLLHLIPTVVGLWLLFWAPARPADPRLPEAARWAGVAATAGGFSLALWARWHLGRYWSGIITLKEGHRLITTGPYSRVRHPIYTGFLAAVAGTGAANGRWPALLAFPIMVVAYRFKAAREERLLSEKFPSEFADYARRTGRLLPRF